MHSEYGGRTSKLREKMKQKGVNLCIITGPSNVYYFTGFDSGTLIVPLDGEPLLLVSRLEYTRALDYSYVKNIVAYSPYLKEKAEGEKVIFKKRSEIVLDIVRDLKKGVVACYPGDLRELSSQKEKIPDVEFKDATPLVSALREIKSPTEIEIIRKASEITGKALEVALESLKEGVREIDIVAEVLYVFSKHEAYPAFPPIVASGPNSAYPHAKPGRRRIEKGDFVVIDIGAKYMGYCADMTRTVIIGEPSEKQKRIFEAVIEAQERALGVLREGASAIGVDNVARDVIRKYGYAPYFNHSLGHGVGLDVHESPTLAPSDKDKILKEGMVVTVEPGVYIHRYGGVRIEDTVLVRKNGFEQLTVFEKRLL
ncbi:MAG: aminopeptidase P family protein [Thermoprotei archaeon]|nr:MAG: aminopeptidase P family protein [Thermoprotei archaeon]RLF02147.1 MAG: aminopeptidase P family protein [Thermoprotei archaeon]